MSSPLSDEEEMTLEAVLAYMVAPEKHVLNYKESTKGTSSVESKYDTWTSDVGRRLLCPCCATRSLFPSLILDAMTSV